MNRRRLILTAAGAGLAASGLGPPAGRAATGPTDDEVAFANFGLAAELLLKDFYARAADARLFAGGAAADISRGRLNAAEHAAALSGLLTGAGQTPAVEEDFEFAWPQGTFRTRRAVATTGLEITRPVLGTYLTAASAITIPSYRTLFASMGANMAQQVAALSLLSGAGVIGVSFPPAVEIEAASDAIEAFLG